MNHLIRNGKCNGKQEMKMKQDKYLHEHMENGNEGEERRRSEEQYKNKNIYIYTLFLCYILNRVSASFSIFNIILLHTQIVFS